MADRCIDAGDILVNLLFPKHVIDYILEKDSKQFLFRTLRETYKFVQDVNKDEENLLPFFIRTGSRVSSLRLPNISIFDGDLNVDTYSSDTDIMVVHPHFHVGENNNSVEFDFIPDPIHIGYGKIACKKGCDEARFWLMKDEDPNGKNMKYLNGVKLFSYAIGPLMQVLEISASSVKTGPAIEYQYEVYDMGKKTIRKVDLLLTLASNQELGSITRNVINRSSWPNSIKEALLRTPLLYIPVSPKTLEDDTSMWRTSFSLHDVLMGRSLCFHKRRLHLVIKYIIKYLTENTKIPEALQEKMLSSYLVLNAFYSFCDRENTYDWTEKMIRQVYKFFKYLAKCLATRLLPQYLYPLNNLLHYTTQEWCSFYANLCTFSSESEIVNFLFNAQKHWRVTQFEHCIQDSWPRDIACSSMIGLKEAKEILFNITIDAVLNLKPARAVQAMCNFIDVSDTVILSDKSSGQSNKNVVLSIWIQNLTERMQKALENHAITLDNYLEICSTFAKLFQKQYRSLAKLCINQTWFKAVKIVKISKEPFHVIKYEVDGDQNGCIFECYSENIAMKLPCFEQIQIFPYTDNYLCYSKKATYFLSCQFVLKSISPNLILKASEDFPRNIRPKFRNIALVKLIIILRDYYLQKHEDFNGITSNPGSAKWLSQWNFLSRI